MGKQKILIVDDDKKITGILSDYFKHENFTAIVLNRGDAVISEVHHNPPDAIILDLMLPGNNIIQTVYGVGYSVNAPQSASADE